MKKFLILLAVSVIAFSFTACTGSTSSNDNTTEPPVTQPEYVEAEDNNYKYHEYADHVIITEYKSRSATVWLPRSYNGKPITSFGQIFRASLFITSVNIPASYTVIEREAFAECYKLQSVTIADGCKAEISSGAFYGCQMLKYASIPASVTKIADDAFKYCTDLFIYGESGSAIETFASNFNSIYFRSKEDDTVTQETTKKSESSTKEDVSEEDSTVEESTVEESTAEEKTTKKPAPKPKATTAAPTAQATTRRSLFQLGQ